MAANNNTGKKKTQSVVVVGANNEGKLPPQAEELERQVLGAPMLDSEASTVVSDILSEDSFYAAKNGVIFRAIRQLSMADQPIDMLTVGDKLKELGELEHVGGEDYLKELTDHVASTAHLRYHAQIVAKKATARDLIRLTASITEQAYDETNDVQDLINNASAGVFEISQRSQKRDVQPVDAVIGEALARIEKAGKNEGNISGIPSGFHDLDKITGGWQPSDLIIIAARPAMGKTAFVLSMAKNIAMNFKRPVALFSLEMSAVQLANRLLMNVCEIEGDKIKSGKLSRAEWRKLEEGAMQLNGTPLYLDDTPQLSVFELQAKARKLKQQHKIEMIIIDYLQLMNASGMNFGSREQEVSIISRNLKGLAKELDIPIIALSQLNRMVEGRTGVEGKKPQLSDLRESGAIEQDADMVCFIHRPEYYHIYDDGNGHDLRGLGQVLIAKHRNGATDDVNLRFVSKLARFQNINEAEPEGMEATSSPAEGGGMRIQSSINNLPQAADQDGAQIDEGMPF